MREFRSVSAREKKKKSEGLARAGIMDMETKTQIRNIPKNNP